MGYNFVVGDRDQLYLLPVSIAEWLPEDHLAWFVLDAVDEMELDRFYAGYRADGWGGTAHHPKMMVALLLYAYSIGLRSSRRIERACQVDVAFRVICANVSVDHTTIARFRQRHEEALKSLFSASLRLCAKAGMATVGVVAVDGTKIGAPASLQANRTKEVIEAEVEAMFAEAAAADAVDDAEFGSACGDEPPATLRGRADRRRRFARAKELLDEELAHERQAHEQHLAERAAKEAERARGCVAGNRKRPRTRLGSSRRR